MPAIQVARTDTFEQQRQKINQLGSTVFNITAGGSDLSTGNLKLGDGTRTAPSLSFVSDSGLGIYKSGPNTFGFVSSSKRISDFSTSQAVFYKNLILKKSIITTGGVSTLNSGTNYDAGVYTNIPLLGGTGDGALANITVTAFDGSITNAGSNYVEGSYAAVPLIGGTGSGSTASFSALGIEGQITNAGTGYVPGTYPNISLTGGSGTGATANITITGQTILSGSITSSGSNYSAGTYNNITLLNSPTTTYTVTTTANLGSPPPNEVYQINGTTQQALTLIKGNTYRFVQSDPSNTGHPLTFENLDGSPLPTEDFVIIDKGVAGSGDAFVDLVIKPTAATQTVRYACGVHSDMGANISITTGSAGRYGSGSIANIETNASGQVSSVTFTSSGTGYKTSDVLQAFSGDIGNGSGFQYTLSGISYTGTVTNVIIVNNGQNYQKNNVLSTLAANLGGSGSGFEYTISNDPGTITNLTFGSKGSGYTIGDELELPKTISGISTNLKSQVSNVSTTLSDTSAVITVSSTTGILSGMLVSADVNDTGELTPNTTVFSVDSLTQITLSAVPAASGSATLTFTSPGANLTEISVTSVSGILVNSIITQTSGTGIISPGSTVTSINSQTNVITLSTVPTRAGTATLSFTPSYGDPISDFVYEINNLGEVESFTISNGGNGYSVSDQLGVNPSLLTQPIKLDVTNKSVMTVTFVGTIASSVFSVGNFIRKNTVGADQFEIFKVNTSGGNITSLLIEYTNELAIGDLVIKNDISTPEYQIATISPSSFRFFINSGNGAQVTPSLTLYSGSIYKFDTSDSSNSGHVFSLSKYRDGIWGPSFIENISATLNTISNQITVTSSTGILPGMAITVTSGTGALPTSTTVQSINGNIITLSSYPLSSGSVILTFRGVEYTDGVVKGTDNLTITVNDDTPNLYYYCATLNSSHQNEGGEDNQEALITTSNTNPKVFGSGFLISVVEPTLSNSVFADIETGNITLSKIISTDAALSQATITGTLVCSTINSNTITVATISSSQDLSISGSAINVNGDFNIGSYIQVINSSGNLTTAGVVKTTNSVNVNDKLIIQENSISSTSGNNIVLSPSTGRVAKISSTSALTIPSGTTSQRPISGIVENGSIRFNTDTNQYEGYSGTTSSWSSLGGVRDLDGNTYITAELTIGSNDNTLWFYNDNINTVKFTPEYQEFVNVKKVRSVNTSAPLYVNWTANTPVTTGQYLKYRNNIYEVVTAGTTGSSGNEPTSTTGTNFTNGTATLKFFITAVAPLTFEEISEVRIAPLGGTSLVINDELSLASNIISTKVNDLLIQPNSGKKVTVDAKTSLVLPVGTTNERGAPVRGSVRFNTTILQYEGYDGANWSSLGGVRDVDGNTYIIPELTPGGNQNILYFYNNGSNTLRVTENEIQLDTIDTITSPTSNALNLEASLVTFNNLAASIDTSSATRTFISTTKDNLDLGLSSGLVNDPLLRLSDTGDIFYNLGFGTGVFNGIKIFDKELKELELADYKIFTEDVTLTKNTVNVGSSVVYNPALHRSAKVQIIAHNETTGDKEFVEYSVIDKGSDIFYTDFGNVKTGAELISCVFDFNVSSNVRVTFTLDSAISSGNVVKVTVISNIIKR